MSKFYRLERFLNNKIDDSFILSFEDIETILGFKLCDSAYNYEAYWNPSDTHTLATAILNCGYNVEPNLVDLKVTFIRVGVVIKKNKRPEEMYFFKNRFILDGIEYFTINNPLTNGPMVARTDGEDISNRKEVCRKFLRYFGWNDAMFGNKVTNELERNVDRILDKNDKKIIITTEDDIKEIQRANKKSNNECETLNITITNELIENAHNAVKATDNYGREDDLITECFKKFPNNTDVNVVAMKIGLIDITNSTHVSQHKSLISVVELAECIIRIDNIDERIKNGDPEVVNEIARCNGKINLFSFASKYCCYHNTNLYGKDDYSILDTVLKESLPKYFDDITKTQIQKWQNTFNYKAYNDYITNKLDELGINVPFRKRKFDHYIWFNNR